MGLNVTIQPKAQVFTFSGKGREQALGMYENHQDLWPVGSGSYLWPHFLGMCFPMQLVQG